MVVLRNQAEQSPTECFQLYNKRVRVHEGKKHDAMLSTVAKKKTNRTTPLLFLCVSPHYSTRAIHGSLFPFYMAEHHIHNLHRPQKQLDLGDITS